MLSPFLWKPAAYRHALDAAAKVDAPVFSDAGGSLTADAPFISFVGRQVYGKA
jgi:hypothetical protein